jgi:signal transduction histidine kinase
MMHRRVRALPVVVLLALAAAASGAFLVVRHAVEEQESTILEERAGEVSLLLQNAVAAVPGTLRSLGVAARVGESPIEAFLAEARAQRSDNERQTIVLARNAGSRFAVVAAEGPALAPGDFLAGARQETAAAAFAGDDVASTPVFRVGAQRALGYALGPPVAPNDHVIYIENPVVPEALTITQERPFEELDAAVYATAVAEPDQLVLTTTRDTPLQGEVAEDTIEVGPERWLLVATAREPLVGSFAKAVPWIILGLGLLTAAIASAVVHVLQRRRDYALALVRERTLELSRSLEELEETQGRLVLQERLAALGRVAAAVGHELRNPLGVLTNSLFLVRSRLARTEALPQDDAERIGRHIDTAEREVGAAVVIVESLLDFAREREPATEPVDLDDLVQESLSVAPSPEGVEIVREGLEGLPPLLADRGQLRQVLLNLITNAYEAMSEQGVLRIAASANGEQVEIRISDTGPGMDEETAKRVFEPFFTQKAKGIGLGLAVSKRIVEAHGGSISGGGAPGGGAAFTLTLPLAPAMDPVP